MDSWAALLHLQQRVVSQVLKLPWQAGMQGVFEACIELLQTNYTQPDNSHCRHGCKATTGYKATHQVARQPLQAFPPLFIHAGVPARSMQFHIMSYYLTWLAKW